MKQFELPTIGLLTEGKLALTRFLTKEKIKERLLRFKQSFRTSHTTRGFCALGFFTALLISITASHIGFVYHTSINGQVVGYVTSTCKIHQAMSTAEARASDILKENYSFNKPVVTTFAIAKSDKCISTSELENAITDQIDEISNLAILSINGVEIGGMESATEVQSVLNQIKSNLTTSLSNPDNADISFQQKVLIQYKAAPTQVKMTGKELFNLLSPGNTTVVYTVPENATVSQVLQETGATLESLSYLNPRVDFTGQTGSTSSNTTATDMAFSSNAKDVSLNNINTLKLAAVSAKSDTVSHVQTLSDTSESSSENSKTPLTGGMQLTIPNTANSILTVQAIEIESRTEEIPYSTVTKENDQLAKGTENVAQEGVTGSKNVTEQVCYVNGIRQFSTVVNSEVTAQPQEEIVEIGTKVDPTVGTGIMIRPFAAGVVTSDYGYRNGGEFHTGVDFAGSAGSNVVAADNGTVIWAGWKGNYGKCVMIDHGNGLVTLYGHNSELEVSVGDVVTQGTVIAKVGSTGRSTGPHCHFEVRLDGKVQNPWNYIS